MYEIMAVILLVYENNARGKDGCGRGG